MKTLQYCGLALIVAGMWGTALRGTAAETYLGAETVLQKIKEQQKAPPKEEKKDSPFAQLREDIKTFGKKVQAMPAAEAAKGWLTLFDRMLKQKPASFTPGQKRETPVSGVELFNVLPPPDAWAELEKAIAARPPGKGKEAMREQGLKLLAYTLNHNVEARKALIAELGKQAKEADQMESYAYNSFFQTLRSAMLASIDDPKIILQMLEQQLAEAQSEYGSDSLNIPNLVSIVGEKDAEAFLRKALVSPKVKLQIPEGTATQKLAQKLALELVNELKTPQWRLITSLDAVDLYEAMDKKFSKPKEAATAPAIPGLPNLPKMNRFGMEDYEKNQARLYYLLGLIAKNRTADAVKIAKEAGKESNVYLPPDAISAMEKAGYSAALADFFHDLLKDNPGLPFWHNYVEISANIGQTERMLDLARAAAANQDLKANKRTYIAHVLVQALLAADQVDEGVAELRKLAGAQTSAEDSDENEVFSMVYSGDAGLQLAKIGQLMKNPVWIDEGLKLARKKVEENSNKQPANPYYSSSSELQLAALLEDLGRGTEAEQLILNFLARSVAAPQQRNYGMDSLSRKGLDLLAEIYHKAGRDADVLTLFDQAPYWQAKDIKEFYLESVNGNEYSHFHTRQEPIGFLLATALIKAHRTDEARPIVNALLDNNPGSDRGYELLLQLDQDKAIPQLDELFARDQYEERPLIWKGKLLFDAGKLDEAETVIRKAVSIDPSDGEQGPDDRMRVYSVLADIREKKGDKKEADLFRGAVQAIRLSEQADKYAQAGLLKRAVRMYRDSLKHFADAYCIQSRLAVQLSDMGLHAEAEAYYQKAYELMPDSFGRVESHCFGCERAFAGERAQSIAERVFTKLAKERPDKPQVHYLLGYLRVAQDRYNEALPHFQKAVELDPAYLNAWVKLEGIAQHTHLSIAEQDRIHLAILRLDPLGRHAQADISNISDLKQLWLLVEKGKALQPKLPEKLYELTASKKNMEEKAKATPQNPYESFSYTRSYDRGSRQPGQILMQVNFIQAAMQLMGTRGGSFMID